MKTFLLSLLLLAGLLGRPAAAADGPPTIPGRLVLRLRPQVKIASLEAALRTLGAGAVQQKFPHSQAPNPEVRGSVDLRPIYQLEVPRSLALSKARTVLLSTGAVEYVEPLYIRTPMYQPNDPRADSTILLNQAGQVNLKRIQAFRAWDISRGDSSIVIGIADSGVRLTHEDLRNQVKHNYADPINGIDDDRDGYVDNFTGWDLANNDNNPGYDPNLNHGTMVASVTSAQTDNGLGQAGLGYKCRFMPLTVFPSTATGTFAGFEAIVYGADHGCQVINVSWGGEGGYSRFEQDVVTYAAINRDVVVVAAAGNRLANVRYYPASYDHVLSVAHVMNNDEIFGGTTYNNRVDLTAPGVQILTVFGYHLATQWGQPDADYARATGSSFATPQVSATAALLRWHFPTYTAAQIRAQIRQTTDDISALPGNLPYAGMLGTGRLNVLKALTRTNRYEARVMSSTFSPQQRTFVPGDTPSLTVDVQNLLLPVTGLTVTLTSLSPYVTVLQGIFPVGNLPTLGLAGNGGAPFRLAVAATGVPLNTTATLRYRLTAAGGFQLDQFVDLTLNPDYVVLNTGDLAVTIGSRSKIGYDDLAGTIGMGVTYRNNGPLLSEGGLLLATSATRLSDRLRTANGKTNESFFRLAQVRRLAPGPVASEEAYAVFQDSLPSATRIPSSVGVRVRQHAYAWTAAGRRDFVLLEYSLRNITADTLKPLYAGLFMDWDLPNGNQAGQNAAAWDSVRTMGYCYDVAAQTTFMGVRLLAGGAPAVYSLDNNAPAGAAVRLSDGFSLAEKFITLSSGADRSHRTIAPPTGADVAQVVGTRLARLAPGDSVKVVFALVGGGSQAQLQTSADAAQTAYLSLAQPTATRAASAAALLQVYPNPTTGQLRVETPAAFGLREVRVLNALGQLVVQRNLFAASAELSLAGQAAGLYLVQVRGTGGVLTRRVEVR